MHCIRTTLSARRLTILRFDACSRVESTCTEQAYCGRRATLLQPLLIHWDTATQCLHERSAVC